MSNEKIKPKLNGTAETMLQCFYARAMHSRNPKNKFHDTKAEELIDRIDYDFSNAKKDTAMSGGIVARSAGQRLYPKEPGLYRRQHRLWSGHSFLPHG